MAFSQLDPARLEGDALKQWYLRSPAEIEAARDATRTQRYQTFVAGIRSVGAPERSETGAARTINASEGYGIGHGSTAQPSWLEDTLLVRRGGNDTRPGQVQIGLVPRKAATSVAGITDCVGCHGRAPPLFPFPVPFRPGGFPVFREGSPQPPSKPPERDRKQCDLQYEFDTDICTGQVKAESKAVCHESAAERLAHCLRFGGVDTPALRTFPRGRRK